MRHQAVVRAAALSAALLASGSALANSVTVVNSLTDTGIRILVYNQNDIVRLIHCAQVDIGQASASTQVNGSTAPDCMNYPGLAVTVRTFKDNYPYASMGTSCSKGGIAWNSTVTVRFVREYQIECD